MIRPPIDRPAAGRTDPTRPPAGIRDLALVLAAVLPGLLLQMIRFEAPPLATYDMNVLVWTTAARNFLELPPARTRLAAILDVVPPGPEVDLRTYSHHPPLLFILLAAAIRLFGDTAVVWRLVPAAACLSGQAILFACLRRAGGRSLAFWGTLLAGITPMMAQFGKMPDHEALTLPCMLLAGGGYEGWLAGGPAWPALVGVALGSLCGWPIHLVPPLILIHHAVAGRRQRPGAGLPLGLLLVSAAAVAALVFHGWWADQAGRQSLLEAFQVRAGNRLTPERSFTSGEFALAMLERTGRYHTWPLIGLAGIGLAAGPRARFLAWLAPGAAFVLIFRQGAFLHDYYLYYLLAGLAALAAQGVLALWRGGQRPTPAARRAARGLALLALLATGYEAFRGANALAHDETQKRQIELGEAILATTPPGSRVGLLEKVSYSIEASARRKLAGPVRPAEELAGPAGRTGLDYLVCRADEPPAAADRACLERFRARPAGKFVAFDLKDPAGAGQDPIWECPLELDRRLLDQAGGALRVVSLGPPVRIRGGRLVSGLIATATPAAGALIAEIELLSPQGVERRIPIRFGIETDVWDRERPLRRLGPPLVAPFSTWAQDLWPRPGLRGLHYFSAHAFDAPFAWEGELAGARIVPAPPPRPAGVRLAVERLAVWPAPAVP